MSNSFKSLEFFRPQSRLRSKIRASNEGLFASLRAKRLGTPGGLRNTVSNLSSRDLSQVELEVLSRGPKFGIPPKTNKEAVLAEFEILFTQLKINIAGASSEEALMSARAKLAAISRDYVDSRPAVKGFAFGKVHYEAIRTLKKDESIVITWPDKGSGTVVMNRDDYLGRMEVILQDESRLEQLGSVNTNDRTPQQERAFQAFLLRLKKEN